MRVGCSGFFFFNDTATTEIYTLSLHDALPISPATPKADTVGWGWDSPEAARLSGVRYAPPRQVFGTLGIPSGEYFDSLGPGYAIGSFVDGPYRGADIVSAERRDRKSVV